MILEKIDSVPMQGNNFTFELQQWLATLVDSLNTTIDQIQSNILFSSSVSGTSQQADLNTAYTILNNAQTSVTLPSSAPVGTRIGVVGFGSSGWKLLTNAGQSIHVINNTANVSVTSAGRYDTISVICVVENSVWVSTSAQTTGFTYT